MKPTEPVFDVTEKEGWDIFQREWMKLVEMDRALGHIHKKLPKKEEPA